MLGIAYTLVALLLIQDFLLYCLLRSRFIKYEAEENRQSPLVSILVPARNEEKLLPACLHSLENLTYPKERIEIILGNDQSTDNTASIMEAWTAKHTNSCWIHIESPVAEGHKINGKANALYQMIKKSKGKLLLFTDADCQVPENWVEEMVAGWREDVGIVTGITAVERKTLFSSMQGIDWWMTLGMVKGMSDLGKSVTSMGNNMLISREAYDKVGGFEGIPFSLTEDFEIARNISNVGYKCIHQVSPKNLVKTQAIDGIHALFHQRKRWLNGAFSLPILWKILLTMQVLFFPAIIFIIWIAPMYGLLIWILKVGLQGLFIRRFAAFVGHNVKIVHLIIFEIYYLLVSWSTIVCYFWPSKTEWKGRKYP